MEEKLLKLLKLADELSDKQNKVFAEVTYTSNMYKTLEISIRSKTDFSYIERCEIQVKENSIISLDNIIELLTFYINGGAVHE